MSSQRNNVFDTEKKMWLYFMFS